MTVLPVFEFDALPIRLSVEYLTVRQISPFLSYSELWQNKSVDTMFSTYLNFKPWATTYQQLPQHDSSVKKSEGTKPPRRCCIYSPVHLLTQTSIIVAVLTSLIFLLGLSLMVMLVTNAGQREQFPPECKCPGSPLTSCQRLSINETASTNNHFDFRNAPSIYSAAIARD